MSLSKEIEDKIQNESSNYSEQEQYGYIEGATQWASDMIPFAKFYEDNKFRLYKNPVITEEALLILYINQTKSK